MGEGFDQTVRGDCLSNWHLVSDDCLHFEWDAAVAPERGYGCSDVSVDDQVVRTGGHHGRAVDEDRC